MRSKTIIASIQSILPLFQTNLHRNLNKHNRTIFTNRYISTLYQNKTQIQEIAMLKKGKFMSNYGSVLEQLVNSKKNGQGEGLVLIIGDPHLELYHSLKSHKIITLEELCALYPEKVPLSYRKKDDLFRQNLQKRIGTCLEKQPKIQTILLTGHNVKMWDEAIQVILDCHPSKIIVEYSEMEKKNDNFYRLNMKDFVNALKTSHKIVYTPTTIPNLHDFNTGNRHINWIINRLRQDKIIAQNQWIVVDEDLCNDREGMIRQGIEVERVDQGSQLWG